LVLDDTTPVVATLPAADNVNAPPVAASPALLMSVLLEIVPEPVVPETATTPPEFVIVVAPVLLRTMAPACVFRLPTAPLPPLILRVPATTLPAVCVMVPAPAVVSVTDVVPVIVLPSDKPPLPAINVVVGEVRAPVVVTLLPAELAFKVNEGALLALSETVAAVSNIETAPVESALRVVALIGLAAEKVIPPVPDFNVVFADVSVPPPVMPLAASVAFKLNEGALVVLTVIAPVVVSVIATAPPEVAWSVFAVVLVIADPPAPAVMINEAVLSPVALLLELTKPLAADNVIDELAV
jgi:hypothetical protein